MQSFTDTQGREWTPAVDVNAVKRVRAMTKVDLLTALEGTLLPRLRDDPVLLVDVLFVLCDAQAERQSVTSEQFGQAMAGDVIDAATEALLQNLVDFFPKARRRPLLAGLAKMSQATNLASERATARIETMDLESLLPPSLGGTSTASPASAGATPGE